MAKNLKDDTFSTGMIHDSLRDQYTDHVEKKVYSTFVLKGHVYCTICQPGFYLLPPRVKNDASFLFF